MQNAEIDEKWALILSIECTLKERLFWSSKIMEWASPSGEKEDDFFKCIADAEYKAEIRLSIED